LRGSSICFAAEDERNAIPSVVSLIAQVIGERPDQKNASSPCRGLVQSTCEDRLRCLPGIENAAVVLDNEEVLSGSPSKRNGERHGVSLITTTVTNDVGDELVEAEFGSG
jgi:hypothetical protein